MTISEEEIHFEGIFAKCSNYCSRPETFVRQAMGCGAGKEKGIKPAAIVPEVQSQQERGQLGETDARAAATGQNEERKVCLSVQVQYCDS